MIRAMIHSMVRPMIRGMIGGMIGGLSELFSGGVLQAAGILQDNTILGQP